MIDNNLVTPKAAGKQQTHLIILSDNLLGLDTNTHLGNEADTPGLLRWS
jgi:hypothetical protein